MIHLHNIQSQEDLEITICHLLIFQSFAIFSRFWGNANNSVLLFILVERRPKRSLENIFSKKQGFNIFGGLF